MSEFEKIEKLLRVVESKIEAHNEFKKEYDRQLAFDFSLFNFFNVGENKVSQILAYFLDEKKNHGQGNAFLNEFVNMFCNQEIDTSDSDIVCEKATTKNRRIDIYIGLPSTTIAIENKIWADDQPNQLKDYSTFLEKKTKGNFLLFYLTPYGSEPSEKSIDEALKQKLVESEKLKIISYKHDIIELINRWLVICEADSVSHFIKEFKKFLEIKFLGNNTLNMSKNLREIIYQNQTEVGSLVAEYKAIENEIFLKLNETGKALQKETPKLNPDLEFSRSGLFNWGGTRVYKFSVSKDENKIWVQFVKNEVHMFSNFYVEDTSNPKFIEIAGSSGLNDEVIVDHKQSKKELIKLFLQQVEMTNEIFKKYDKSMAKK
jgi:hypothetical protein